jgi:phospholipase C
MMIFRTKIYKETTERSENSGKVVMKYSRLILYKLAGTLFLTCAVVYLTGCSGSATNMPSFTSSTNSTTWQQARGQNLPLETLKLQPTIQHVVVIFQENRTPDNLFHGLPGADIADSGLNSKGQTVPLTPIHLAAAYDLDHSHKAFEQMHHRGKMDGADKVQCGGACPANPQFKYVNPSEVTPYFQLAETYTFADRMFQTQQGPSFPAHQFIISGTSAPTATSDLFAAENPFQQSGPPAKSTFLISGCTAPADITVRMIDPSGLESTTQHTCFEHPTLIDLLDFKKIDWRYYSVGDSWNAIWNGPSAIQHLRQGPDWAKVIPRPKQVLEDIANGQLPAVTWVIPSGRTSDHPLYNDGSGPSWVAAIVNAIGHSRYWIDTAIFITWDDWGGFYDHVPPPIYNSYEYGFRVPLIVVSPYAKRGHVSHVTHDFGSILRFIEERFDLPSLGYADSRADDLSDCFDFTQWPQQFRTIAAPLTAEHFLKDEAPPTDPDDD